MTQEAQISSENVKENTSISATEKESREVITILLSLLLFFFVSLVPRYLLQFQHAPSVICSQFLCGVIHLTTFRGALL